VLRELSAPGTGGLKRVLQTLLEGITLGVLLQPPSHPVAGYIALLSLVLFLVSLFLLPARTRTVPKLGHGPTTRLTDSRERHTS
jgi:hypothetical protein